MTDLLLTLAIIDEEDVAIKEMIRQLEVYNISSSHHKDLTDLMDAIKTAKCTIPDLILVDSPTDPNARNSQILDNIPDLNHTLSLYSTKRGKKPIWLAYSEDQSIDNKLRAAQAGLQAFMDKPLKVDRLVEKLDEMLLINNDDPLRILIIDDTPAATTAIVETLESAGMNTLVLLDPKQTFEMLPVFRPDLVLIDLYMPEINGNELVRAIRYFKKFNTLSLVYMSNENDIHKQLAALQCGADDFLPKALPPQTLALSVEAKAKRSRYFNTLMVTDSLTGLYNYSYCFDLLFHKLDRSQRNAYPLTVAFLVVDHYKRINDQYGHATGDAILKVIAHILQHRLRKSDIIGRNVGVGFFIILPDTTEQAAFAILDSLRANFAKVRHEQQAEPSSAISTPTSKKSQTSLPTSETAQETFTTTFSAGLATFPKYNKADELLTAAENALMTVQASSSNRIEIG